MNIVNLIVVIVRDQQFARDFHLVTMQIQIEIKVFQVSNILQFSNASNSSIGMTDLKETLFE